MSHAQVYTSSNFDEIGSNDYEDIVLPNFSGSLPVVTLTLILIPNANHH